MDLEFTRASCGKHINVFLGYNLDQDTTKTGYNHCTKFCGSLCCSGSGAHTLGPHMVKMPKAVAVTGGPVDRVT